MRFKLAFAAISTIALTACGEGTSVEDPSDPEQVAEAVADLPNPEPGEYSTTGELVEFTAAGMPEEEMAMARTFMEAIFTQPQSQCITEEQSAQGYEDFVSGMQDSEECEMSSFDTSANSFSANMTCDAGEGNAGDITYAGEVSEGGMEVTMTMEGVDPEMGEMRMVVNLQSQRVGDCAE